MENVGFEQVSDFALCQVADSTALNPKIARLLDIKHVACRNHCLNLACKDMEIDDPGLKVLIADTQEVHRKIRASNKLSAVLANASEHAHRLKLQAVTRWNSVCDLFLSHEKSANEIRAVAEAHPGRVSDDCVSQAHLLKIKQHSRYLSTIKEASCGLQTSKLTLAAGHDMLETLAACVNDGRGVQGDDFEYSTLKCRKFLVGNDYDTSDDFITGTIKIQVIANMLYTVTCSVLFV